MRWLITLWLCTALACAFSPSFTAMNRRFSRPAMNKRLFMCSSAAAEHSPIRLSIPEQARTIASTGTSGTFCTVKTEDSNASPTPFGSYVDYILDDKGWPVLLLSAESMHSKNAAKHPRVSFFCHTPKAHSNEEAVTLSWVTLTGDLEEIPQDSLQQLKLAFSVIHQASEPFLENKQFGFKRIKPAMVYFGGGYDVESRYVSVDDYENCKPDVIAAEASDIVAKANVEKRSELETVAKQIVGVSDKLDGARMVGIDRLGIDLRVSTSTSTDEYRIAFRNPVATAEDARSELTKLFQEAWERDRNLSPWKDLPRVEKYAEDVTKLKH